MTKHDERALDKLMRELDPKQLARLLNDIQDHHSHIHPTHQGTEMPQ